MTTSTLLIPLLIAQLSLAGWLMWRRPYHPLSIVGMLTTLFSYLPAVLVIDGSGFVSYTWRNFTFLDLDSGVEAAIFMGVLNLCLLIGAAIAEQTHRTRNLAPAAPDDSAPHGTLLYGSRKITSISAAYFLLWLLVAFILYRQSGQGVVDFLLPIKETGIASEQSGYLRSLYLAIPVSLVIISYWKNGNFRYPGWAWVLLSLVATFSTHQRRELVTTALLILSLSLFLGPLRSIRDAAKREKRKAKRLATDPVAQARRARLTVLLTLAVGLALVPLLWYSRVYFTNRSESNLNVFEIRSVSDIVLGSPTGGFPAFILIQQHVENYGTNPFYLLAYSLTIFVPRTMWAGKPTDLDSVLQSHYYLAENPSSFWYGEIFYTFGHLAPVVVIVLAYLLYSLFLKCETTPHIWYRTMAAVLFMQSVTLFKNGIAVFIIKLFVLVLLLGIVWLFCRRDARQEIPNEARRVSETI